MNRAQIYRSRRGSEEKFKDAVVRVARGEQVCAGNDFEDRFVVLAFEIVNAPVEINLALADVFGNFGVCSGGLAFELAVQTCRACIARSSIIEIPNRKQIRLVAAEAAMHVGANFLDGANTF